MTIRLRILFALQFLTCACSHRAAIELREIAHFNTSGWSHDISLDGGNLYLADRQGGFLVFDKVSGYQRPKISAPVRDVISLAPRSGAPVLASRFEGIVILSASGKICGRFSNGDVANAVEVRGDLAFAAYGRHGLGVLRIVDGHARFVAALPTIGWSHDLRLSGQQALLADWNGLRVVDIREPGKPVQIAFLPSPATCISLAVKESGDGRIVALAEGHAGITLARLDAGGQPTVISRHSLGLSPSNRIHPKTGGWVHSVAWAGRYLFAANWKSGLALLDVADLRNSRLILQRPTSGTALSVKTMPQADGSFLVYLADGESGLRVFKFTIRD